MSNNYDRLIALTQKLDDKLMQKDNISKDINTINVTSTQIEKWITDAPIDRKDNIKRLEALLIELGINKKCSTLQDAYHYKAMNLSGIGISENDFGEIRAGKYIQIIAISYESGADDKKKAKNISLGYFGSGANITSELKNSIIEFVLRWRYEKGFQSQDHYKLLMRKLVL